jgi:hypothetical protein
MRTIPLLLAFSSLVLCPIRPAFAQVSDAERAAARDLFKQGDQLQRAGQFSEALDKFQRAQQVFSAPTNLLRIAECDAALGRLVESAEAYREVLRTPLPAGAPPAFQAAVDQAKAELSQVEPRVPKLVVQMQPAGVQNARMQIDGQNVPGALIGEPISLDSGVHKIVVLAPGYSSAEQQVELKEHESKTTVFALTAAPGAAYPSGPPAGASPAVRGEVPPPPIVAVDLRPPPPPSRAGILVGAHLGVAAAAGGVPLPDSSKLVEPSEVGSGGLAVGMEGGLRFDRHWYLGAILEHAALGNGSRQGSSSNTTLLGVVLGFIGNPDQLTFYGEIGLGTRWFSDKDSAINSGASALFHSGELSLGGGIWIPAGHSWRIVPKLTLGFDSFSTSPNDGSSPSSQLATFGMLGVAGFYNDDL